MPPLAEQQCLLRTTVRFCHDGAGLQMQFQSAHREGAKTGKPGVGDRGRDGSDVVHAELLLRVYT